MWRWIRPLHECTCAHFTSLTRPYCAVFPADPKRFKLCARQRTVGRSSHGGTLSTFSYYRQCVFPTPKENLVWPERTVSVLREDNVCIIAAFKIKLNVFLIPDKFIQPIHEMVFVNWWKIQINSGNCLRKETYYVYSIDIVVLI